MSTTSKPAGYRFVFFAIIAMSLLRAFLAGWLGLGDDEAYYWDWSRHLQLSYYDHPGMTAWMIKIGTEIFGQNPFGVRVLGLVCNALTGVLLWRLGERIFGATAAWIAVALYFFAPIFSLGGILMVPDAPMGVFWVAFALVAWRILNDDDTRLSTWALAGALLGVGLLSKYTIILLAGSTVLFMTSQAKWRRYFLQPGFWLAVVVAALLCLPIILWNTAEGWPTLAFHLHDRHTGGGGANFARWGQFWASQAIALGPALLLLCLGAWVLGLWRRRDPRWHFMLALSFPTFGLFAAQALFSEFKPHWPAPAYILAFIMVGEWLREGLGFASAREQVWARRSAIALVLAVIVPINLIFYVSTIWPVLPKLARVVAPQVEWDPKFDPTNDLFGWPEAVARAQELRRQMSSSPQDVFLASSRYQLVSQIAFIASERVWRVSPGQDQYSFWQTPEDQAPLIGRDAIYVTDRRYERDPRHDFVFAGCEPEPPLKVYRGDELAREFLLWRCSGFKGLPQRQ